MILHTVNKSPLNSPCLNSCLRTIAQNDALLLMEDVVYGAVEHFSALLVSIPEGVPVFVLQADLLARGLQERLNPSVQVVDDEGFVDLCCQYSKTQSWY